MLALRHLGFCRFLARNRVYYQGLQAVAASSVPRGTVEQCPVLLAVARVPHALQRLRDSPFGRGCLCPSSCGLGGEGSLDPPSDAGCSEGDVLVNPGSPVIWSPASTDGLAASWAQLWRRRSVRSAVGAALVATALVAGPVEGVPGEPEAARRACRGAPGFSEGWLVERDVGRSGITPAMTLVPGCPLTAHASYRKVLVIGSRARTFSVYWRFSPEGESQVSTARFSPVMSSVT